MRMKKKIKSQIEKRKMMRKKIAKKRKLKMKHIHNM